MLDEYVSGMPDIVTAMDTQATDDVPATLICKLCGRDRSPNGWVGYKGAYYCSVCVRCDQLSGEPLVRCSDGIGWESLEEPPVQSIQSAIDPNDAAWQVAVDRELRRGQRHALLWALGSTVLAGALLVELGVTKWISFVVGLCVGAWVFLKALRGSFRAEAVIADSARKENGCPKP